MRTSLHIHRNPLLAAGCLAVGLGLAVPPASAAPYASSLTNNAGVVSFRLNEAADSVEIKQGATTVALGALPAGLTVTNLSASITAGLVQVVVHKSSACGMTLVNGTSAFNQPRGVAVNKNASSPFFGRIYVANGLAGTRGDGIFLFNSDLSDAVGQGDTARTAGLDFVTNDSSVSPYRLTVGEDDDQVYICDWTNPGAALYVADPDVLVGGHALKPLAPNQLGNLTAGMDLATPQPMGENNNHGSVAAVAVTGKLSSGDLVIYTVDEDLQQDRTSATPNQMNSVWRYPVGAGPLPFDGFDPSWMLGTPVVNFVSQTMDLARGPNGYLYMSQYRSAGSQPGVYVVDPNLPGILADSLALSLDAGVGDDILKATGGVAVSPSGRWLATINIENNRVAVAPLVGGIPDLTKVVFFTGLGTGTGRSIAFDPADNLLVVTLGAGLRQVSLGHPTIATTGSDGTFSLAYPGSGQTVSVMARPFQDTASEMGPVPAYFDITRSGDLSSPLTVNFTLTGTATFGVDYIAVPLFVTFEAFQTEASVTITPIDDDESELDETVILTLECGGNYETLNRTATVTIVDNDPPLVTITAVATSMYEPLASDFVSFRITRTGDIFNLPTEVNLVYSGTAQNGVDYAATNVVVINENFAGTNSALLVINPIDDNLVEGNETITVTIAPGAGYAVGAASSATATIVDDDLPPATVLFADNFDTDTSANWSRLVGWEVATPLDVTNQFSVDYSQFGIPAPPGTATTRGLLASVNKLDATQSAAGVNFYPIGQSFSGDYALRFQMYHEGVNGGGTTEHIIFGINHSGTKTNWFHNQGTGVPAGWEFDGIWAQVGVDSSALGDYVLNSAPITAAATRGPTARASRAASTLTANFKAPPYRFAGSPGSFGPLDRRAWVDVELRQLGNLVSLYLNRTFIFAYTNTTADTSGTVMLGYNDAYRSIGGGVNNFNLSLGGFVIFDNLRVVRIGAPVITGIALEGGNAVITFTSDSGEMASQFTLQTASDASGAYTDSAAPIITLSPGVFQTQAPLVDLNQFFRIRVRN